MGTMINYYKDPVIKQPVYFMESKEFFFVAQVFEGRRMFQLVPRGFVHQIVYN